LGQPAECGSAHRPTRSATSAQESMSWDSQRNAVALIVRRDLQPLPRRACPGTPHRAHAQRVSPESSNLCPGEHVLGPALVLVVSVHATSHSDLRPGEYVPGQGQPVNLRPGEHVLGPRDARLDVRHGSLENACIRPSRPPPGRACPGTCSSSQHSVLVVRRERQPLPRRACPGTLAKTSAQESVSWDSYGDWAAQPGMRASARSNDGNNRSSSRVGEHQDDSQEAAREGQEEGQARDVS
jgi:hypothetical protein